MNWRSNSSISDRGEPIQKVPRREQHESHLHPTAQVDDFFDRHLEVIRPSLLGSSSPLPQSEGGPPAAPAFGLPGPGAGLGVPPPRYAVGLGRTPPSCPPEIAITTAATPTTMTPSPSSLKSKPLVGWPRMRPMFRIRFAQRRRVSPIGAVGGSPLRETMASKRLASNGGASLAALSLLVVSESDCRIVSWSETSPGRCESLRRCLGQQAHDQIREARTGRSQRGFRGAAGSASGSPPTLPSARRSRRDTLPCPAGTTRSRD